MNTLITASGSSSDVVLEGGAEQQLLHVAVAMLPSSSVNRMSVVLSVVLVAMIKGNKYG